MHKISRQREGLVRARATATEAREANDAHLDHPSWVMVIPAGSEGEWPDLVRNMTAEALRTP